MAFDKSRLHLVPISICDIADKLFDKNMNSDHVMTYVNRLEATRAYIDYALAQHNEKHQLKRALN